jgi:hypothetical protein
MEVLNDLENRDESEPEQQANDGEDEPHDESGERDEEPEAREPDQSVRSFELPNPGRPVTYGRGAGRDQSGDLRTGSYGKSAPSILDDMRAIRSELKPPAPGGGKSAEIDL